MGIHILIVIGCHWTMAITLIFVNKQLVTNDERDQDMTVFIAWAQSLVGVVFIFLGTTAKCYYNQSTPWSGITPSTFIHTDVLAMSITFVGVIIMNNLLLKHIGVAFYQVARSSTLIFAVLFSKLILGGPIAIRVLFSCCLIMGGFFVSVKEERLLRGLTFQGILYGILASLFAALSGIYCKRVAQVENGNTLKISLLTNMNSFVILFPLVLGTGQLQYAWYSGRMRDVVLCYHLIVTGVLSLLVGWISNVVISLTSPVTHHVSINAKSLLQTLIAVVMHNETKTAAWWVGNFLVIIGILSYAFHKTDTSKSDDPTEIIIPDSKDKKFKLTHV